MRKSAYIIVEKNAYNGLFSDNVNKIDCDGIIKNIPVNTYNKHKNKFRAQE